jgi:hypothetical protein
VAVARFSISSFLAGVVVAAAVAAVPATAAQRAAGADADPLHYDGTAPVLTVLPQTFDLGRSIDASVKSSDSCLGEAYHFKVPMTLRWSASDSGSGLKGYQLWRDYEPIWSPDAPYTSQTQESLDAYNYASECGGGDIQVRRFVLAEDNRGNQAISALSGGDQVDVWQEDGTMNPAGKGAKFGTLSAARIGTWAVGRCLCFDAGQTLYSTKGGNSITYTVTPRAPGQTFALVMEKSYNRGRVGVSVNGAAPQTVDTYSASPQHRVIVWQRTLDAGVTTIKVTNQATPGRTRVDLDAVMLNNPPGGMHPLLLPPGY